MTIKEIKKEIKSQLYWAAYNQLFFIFLLIGLFVLEISIGLQIVLLFCLGGMWVLQFWYFQMIKELKEELENDIHRR